MCIRDRYYVKKGALDWNYTGLCLYGGTWYYVKRGALDWNYTGVCDYYGTTYYIINGAVSYTHLDVYKRQLLHHKTMQLQMKTDRRKRMHLRSVRKKSQSMVLI